MFACLERVAASPHFARSLRLQEFLGYSVRAALEGRTEEVKERTIAVEVYGRSLEYDPRCDPIVRSEAHRLRTKLAAYYAREGCSDPIVIELPKGGYVPRFRANDPDRARHFGIPRLVVTCFAERSAEGEESGFGLGMSQAVSERLSGRPGLRVVYRRSVGEAGRTPRPGDAEYAVGGTFERTGRRCRLAARVERVADSEEIWSESYEFPWKRVSQVQDEVAERVAASVGSLLARAGERASTADPHAYEAFVKARFSVLQYANTHHAEFLEPARRRLLRTIELAPDHADALAELAYLHVLQLYPLRGDAAEHVSEARALLVRALAADPRHVRGLWLLGQLRALEGRPREALDLSETAVALDPDDAEARACLAARYLSLGFYEAALVASVHALDLDPLWHLPHETRVVCLVRLGRLSEAHAAADQLCREDPDTPTGEFLRASVRIAEGDLEGAEAALAPRRHGLSHPDDGGRAEVVRGLVAALRGEEDEARRVLEKYCGSPPRFHDHLLRLALALGEIDVALGHLARGMFNGNYRWLASEPLARPLFAEPRLRKRLEELHGEWLGDLEELGPRLPAHPLLQPLPEALLSAPARLS